MRSLGVLTGLSVAATVGYYRRWFGTHRKRSSARSDIVQTDLGPIEYDIRGSGPVVLHFHGATTGHNGWFFLKHLVDAGYTLLSPDRPGYLGTPLQDNGTPEAQADLAAALLNSLDIDRVAVVGISGGGPPALQFALRHPDRTQALMLLAAISKRTPLSSDQLNSTAYRLLMSSHFQNVTYFLLHQAMKRMPRYALRSFIRTETTYDAEKGRRYLRQILDDPDQRQQVMKLADALVPASPRLDGLTNDIEVQETLNDLPLDQIRTPTLIVHSRHDGDVPYENATYAHSQIPNSTLGTVDQFGHLVWLGDPDVTADLQSRIEEFLSDNFDNPLGCNQSTAE